MISVVIPVYNEIQNIEKCVESLKNINPDEIIVVDGGSSDGTIEKALSLGVKVINSKKGRGIQIQAGIEQAQGDIILILHADTCLSFDIIRDDFDLKEGFCGGFFRLRYDKKNYMVKIVEFFANLRSFLHSMPYGDQAIFVRKNVLCSIGGLKDYQFLEDVDLVLRLRKFGKLKGIKKDVIVSARRLIKGGFFHPIFHSIKNFFIVILFLLGVSPHKLIRLYK